MASSSGHRFQLPGTLPEPATAAAPAAASSSNTTVASPRRTSSGSATRKAESTTSPGHLHRHADPQSAVGLSASSTSSRVPTRKQSGPPTPFRCWFHLLVEAVVEYGELPELVAAQLTCRAVALLLAQRRAFCTHFWCAMQPFERFPEKKGAAAASTGDENEGGNSAVRRRFTTDTKNGHEVLKLGLPDVVDEEVAMRALLFGEQQQQEQTSEAAQAQQLRIALHSWKVISSRYRRQTLGVACVARTPEFFRGVYRIPARSIWRMPALHTMETPPFFMLPRIARRRLAAPLKQSAVPAAVQQAFSLVLQRTSRPDGNALGIFLAPATPGPIEGRTLEVVFSIATLDFSLVPPVQVKQRREQERATTTRRVGDYKPIRKYCGLSRFTSQQANSGFVFSSGHLTRADAPVPAELRQAAAIDSHEVAATLGLDAAEDIVVEVEAFCLGGGVTDPAEVLTYSREIAAVFDLEATAPQRQPPITSAATAAAAAAAAADSAEVIASEMCGASKALRNHLWNFIRNQSHDDPYSPGLQKKRRRFLTDVLPAMLRELSNDEHPDDDQILQNCSGVLWNMTDVDQLSRTLSRAQVQAVIRGLALTRVRRMFAAQMGLDPDTRIPAAQPTPDDDPALYRALIARATYVQCAGQLLACLWNAPQSVAGTLSMFGYDTQAKQQSSRHDNGDDCQPGTAFLHLLFDVLERELAFARAIDAAEQHALAHNEDPELAADQHETPNVPLLVAALHYLSSARFWLRDVVRVRRVFEQRNSIGGNGGDKKHNVMMSAVGVLRKRVKLLLDIGVSLFPRDYACYYVGMLCAPERCAPLELVAFASFMFDAVYVLPPNSRWIQEQRERERLAAQQAREDPQEAALRARAAAADAAAWAGEARAQDEAAALRALLAELERNRAQ